VILLASGLWFVLISGRRERRLCGCCPGRTPWPSSGWRWPEQHPLGQGSAIILAGVVACMSYPWLAVTVPALSGFGCSLLIVFN